MITVIEITIDKVLPGDLISFFHPDIGGVGYMVIASTRQFAGPGSVNKLVCIDLKYKSINSTTRCRSVRVFLLERSNAERRS